MIEVKDKNAKNWLTEHINWIDAQRPLTINNFLPPVFDNYIAILWTPGIIDNFPFEKIIQPPITNEQSHTNRLVWREFKLSFATKNNDELYRPTTFAELSIIFNKTYDRHIIDSLPWETLGITTLFKQTQLRLESTIRALSNLEELKIYVDDYYRWAVHDNILPSNEGVVYKIYTSEFFEFMNKTIYDASLYLYSEDKNWCLINLEDLGYNILAYNNSESEKVAALNLKDTFELSIGDILFN